MNMGVSKNKRTPKWMVYFMENPMNKWMILGYAYFWKHQNPLRDFIIHQVVWHGGVALVTTGGSPGK